MKRSDVTVLTCRHVVGILRVNENGLTMRKSENCDTKFFFTDRVFRLVRNSTHNSFRTCTQIYDVTLPQRVYLQHGGDHRCSYNDLTVTPRIREDILKLKLERNRLLELQRAELLYRFT